MQNIKLEEIIKDKDLLETLRPLLEGAMVSSTTTLKLAWALAHLSNGIDIQKNTFLNREQKTYISDIISQVLSTFKYVDQFESPEEFMKAIMTEGLEAKPQSLKDIINGHSESMMEFIKDHTSKSKMKDFNPEKRIIH